MYDIDHVLEYSLVVVCRIVAQKLLAQADLSALMNIPSLEAHCRDAETFAPEEITQWELSGTLRFTARTFHAV